MSSKARRKLEEYDIENAGAFDLSVVVHGYMRQTPDDEAEQQRVIEGVLVRWKAALLKQAAPELEAKLKRAQSRLREVGQELVGFAEELNGKS
jgi:hypothetical protein